MREKKIRKINSIRELWNNFKQKNIQEIGVPKG